MCGLCLSAKDEFSTFAASFPSIFFPPEGPILQSGILRKLNTLKKKYFVLRGEALGYPACLEYYDSQKKFEKKNIPKRRIFLRSCFSINKYVETRQKYCIALNTMDDCFCFVLESNLEMENWLSSMLLLRNKEQPTCKQPQPNYDHVWPVKIQKKELGVTKNINGPCRLCLANEAVTFAKIGTKNKSEFIDVPLKFIKRCGFRDQLLYLEMGKMTIMGAGDFWIETKDKHMALSMCVAIMDTMINLHDKNKKKIECHQRTRTFNYNNNNNDNNFSNRQFISSVHKTSYLSHFDFSKDRDNN